MNETHRKTTSLYTKSVLRNIFKSATPDRLKEKIGRDARLILYPFFNGEGHNNSYPDLSAQSCNEVPISVISKPSILTKSDTYKNHLVFLKIRHESECTPLMIRTVCPEGHIISKSIFCGREWCHTCGKLNSLYHKRRVDKWIPKINQINTLGYLVITFPENIRNKFATKFDLNNFRTYIRRKLKREGFAGIPVKHGFLRWHWAGDCKGCNGRGCGQCENKGAEKKYHPHLNILFPSNGFVNQSEIESFRSDIENWLTAYAKTDCKGKGNVNYSYHSSDSKKKHLLKYVTRATWRYYDEKICTIIKGYRTGVSFGKWEKLKFENSSQAIENKVCPICLKNDGVIHKLSKMTYAHIKAEKFNFENQVEISPGVYYKRC